MTSPLTPPKYARLRNLAPLLFRFAAVLGIGWLIHVHHLRVASEGDEPIRMSEVREWLPDAHQLRFDAGPRRGFQVVDPQRKPIGYVARTMPDCREINGYSGPSDVLAVFDDTDALLGIHIRQSYDTPSHVKDVAEDYTFMEQWNGFSWDKIAGLGDLSASGIYGVSGASRTSEAVGRGLALRMAESDVETAVSFKPRWQDLALLLVACTGLILVFLKKGWVQKRKTWLHILMVVYLGIVSGDLLAQSLTVSWATHGIPWQNLPGLVVLALVALLTPWSTGQRVYCTQICPHGHIQRWLVKVLPSRFTVKLGHEEKWSFRALPGLLLVSILIITFLKLPLDLAGFEAFDAWSIKGAGVATLSVFAVGLIYSLFVPMGYCRHGCPTGFLLDLVKRERAGFVKRDLWLLALLVLAVALYVSSPQLKLWLIS